MDVRRSSKPDRRDRCSRPAPKIGGVGLLVIKLLVLKKKKKRRKAPHPPAFLPLGRSVRRRNLSPDKPGSTPGGAAIRRLSSVGEHCVVAAARGRFDSASRYGGGR